MSVKIIRLSTGEELIGSWNEHTSSITDPALIAVGANPLNNQMKVQIVPWAMFTKTATVKINPAFIVYIEDPDDQVYNKYNQTFGSGIQIAQL